MNDSITILHFLKGSVRYFGKNHLYFDEKKRIGKVHHIVVYTIIEYNINVVY